MGMTREQLEALPERPDYRIEVLPDGTSVRHRIVHPFGGRAPQPEDILLFRDSNGDRWLVEYHLEGGPYKRRFPY